MILCINSHWIQSVFHEPFSQSDPEILKHVNHVQPMISNEYDITIFVIICHNCLLFPSIYTCMY